MVDELDDGNGIVTDFSGDTELDSLFQEPPSDELGAVDVNAGVELSANTTPATPPAPGGQPAAQPAAQAPSQPGQPAAPQPNQAAAPQPQSAPQPGASSQPPSFEQYVTANYDKLVNDFANGAFAPTEDEKKAFGEAAPVVAKYMARAQINNMVMMQRALAATLPDTVANLVNVSRQSMDAETEFLTAYPELKAVPRNSMAQIGYALRNANPNMTREEFLPMLARTIAAAASIQLKPQRGQPTPHQPAANGQRGGVNPHPTPRTRVQHGEMNGADQLAGINQMLRFS